MQKINPQFFGKESLNFFMKTVIYGYQEIHMLLRFEGKRISEKVVRRIMKQENLMIRRKRRQKCNSY